MRWIVLALQACPPLGAGEEKQAERDNHDDERQAPAGTCRVGFDHRSLAVTGLAALSSPNV